MSWLLDTSRRYYFACIIYIHYTNKISPNLFKDQPNTLISILTSLSAVVKIEKASSKTFLA